MYNEPKQRQKYQEKGYTGAEVEILLQLQSLEESLTIVLETYVKRTEFEPVRNLVYGAAGLILTGIMVALIASVVR